MQFQIVSKLSKCIIRPPRMRYALQDFGQNFFQFHNVAYQRIDFQTKNFHQHRLQCSLFKQRFNTMKARVTIVYLHANSSSRLSIKNYLSLLLPVYDVACFDFSGSGLSQGQYITLGYKEKQDLQAVMQKLRYDYKVKQVFLWGKSMGAATSLLYAGKYSEVLGIVCDSAFSDLEELVRELGNEYMPILPNFIISPVIQMIQNYIVQQAQHFKELKKFNIYKLKPIADVKKIKVPIYFIGSQDDKLVKVTHTQFLYGEAKYRLKSIVKGGHNEQRSDPIKQQIMNFFENILIGKYNRKAIFQQIREIPMKVKLNDGKQQFENNRILKQKIIPLQDQSNKKCNRNKNQQYQINYIQTNRKNNKQKKRIFIN